MEDKDAKNPLEQCLRNVSLALYTLQDNELTTALLHHLQMRWVAGEGRKPYAHSAQGYWPKEAYRTLRDLFESVPHVLLDDHTSLRGEERSAQRRDYLLGSRETPEGFVSLWHDSDDECSYQLVTTNAELFGRVGALFREYDDYEDKAQVEKEEQHAFMLVTTQHGMATRSIGLAGVPLVRENYSPASITAFTALCTELRSETPTGRLAVITGASGTGKSFLIRGLMHELPNIRFLFVPTDIVASLGQPELISVLFDLRDNDGDRRTVVVAEDADAILITREVGSSVALSTVLNLTSGVLGELLDVRIIATTNAEHFEVDVALRRPGRLIDLGVTGGLEIGLLNVEQARAALVNLLKNDPEAESKATAYVVEDMTIAAVYMQARRLGWKG